MAGRRKGREGGDKINVLGMEWEVGGDCCEGLKVGRMRGGLPEMDGACHGPAGVVLAMVIWMVYESSPVQTTRHRKLACGLNL